MFISDLEVTLLSIPLKKPIITNLHTLKKINCLAVRVYTNNGLIGHGLIRGLGQISCVAVKKYIEEIIKPRIINSQLIDEKFWQEFWQINKAGKSVGYIYALAALDIAMWDIFTKFKNVTLHQHLGGAQLKIPVYGTTGWLSLTDFELIEECQRYAAKGIKAFKIRLGHPEDRKRVALVRNIMGNDFMLMVDANQRYDVNEAIHMAEMLEEFNISWFEEPVANSAQDLLNVATNTKIPIAVGENISESKDFETICQMKAATFLQPDILRCGGITGFREIAQIIQNYNLHLCNHLLPELSVSLISAYSNGYILEYDDLLPENFFTHDFLITNGYMHVPNTPGTGVEINQKTLKKFNV